LRGALAHWYQPHKTLLNFDVQPSMFGKAIVDGFGLINGDFDPCPYHTLTSIGSLERA